jgi:PAS domain S-box-containing protein
MTPLRDLGLLTKINLIIALILLLFLALSAFFSHRQQTRFIIGEAVEKSRIIAFEAIRTREYLSNQYQIGDVELSVERYDLIPVVASNRIGALVGEDLGYTIRQVSDRYRNPRNAPDPFESAVLQTFYEDPQRQELYTINLLEGERVFRYMQAFTADESCLECHGDPDAAPDYIKILFPEEEDPAYHYRIGEVIGAASVTIPMERLSRQIYANLRTEILITGGIFLALITSLGLLIRLSVTRPLGHLGAVVGEIVRTGRLEEKIPPRGGDEIGALIVGFNEMIDNLREKTEHLEESEKRFRLLTETARDAIISFLANGQIILFNNQAERLFNYKKIEVLGMNIDRFIDPECASVQQVGVEEYLRQEGEKLLYRTHTVVFRRRDGSPLTLELSLSVTDSEGHLFYTAFLREISA